MSILEWTQIKRWARIRKLDIQLQRWNKNPSRRVAKGRGKGFCCVYKNSYVKTQPVRWLRPE